MSKKSIALRVFERDHISSMKIKNWLADWPLIPVVILVNWLVLKYVNFKSPVVGHDYYFQLPRMIDTKLHTLINGWGVQWYTPTFGGGLPAFANPLSVQYSIPHFLYTFFDLWTSIEMTIVLTIALGMSATYLILRQRFAAGVGAATLGALFYGLNGFSVNHFMAGHLNYHLIHFAPVLVYGMTSARVRPIFLNLFSASIFALVLHSGAIQALVAMTLSVSICILLFSCLGASLAQKGIRVFSILSGLALGFCISAAKVNAVFSFMKFFPREMESSGAPSYLSGLMGIATQLVGYPTLRLFGLTAPEFYHFAKSLNGNDYSVWEQDVAMPAAFFAILGLVLIFFVFSSRGRSVIKIWWSKRVQQKWIWIFGILTVWGTIEIITANGPLFALFKSWPILKSLHVNVRFTGALVLPLCLAAGLSYEVLRKNLSLVRKFSGLIAAQIVVLSLAHFTFYELLINETPELMSYDYSPNLNASKLINEGFRFVPVEINANVGDDRAIVRRASNMRPYEPIFGYGLENFKPRIEESPIDLVTEGKFNFTNPASLVFPIENELTLFEKISESDIENFKKFVNRKQPNWQISTLQRIANSLSVIGLLVWLGLALWSLSNAIFKFSIKRI